MGDLLAGLSGFASEGSEAAEGSEDWPIGGFDVGVVALQVAEDLFGGGDSVQRHEDLFDGFGQGCGGVVVVHGVVVGVGVGVGLIAHCCNHIIWVCGENHVCIIWEDVLNFVDFPIDSLPAEAGPGELGEGARLVGDGLMDVDDAFLGQAGYYSSSLLGGDAGVFNVAEVVAVARGRAEELFEDLRFEWCECDGVAHGDNSIRFSGETQAC